MNIKQIVAGALAAAVVGLAAPALAETVLVTGSGTFLDHSPTKFGIAPDETWSFSFEVSNPTPGHAALTNADYKLNGVSVVTPLTPGAMPHPVTSVDFFDSAANGLFNINFGEGVDDPHVEFFGPVVGPDAYGAAGPLLLGTFTAEIGEGISITPDLPIVEYGAGRVTLADLPPTISAPGVPEPASWALMLLGFGSLGGVLRGRRVALLVPA